MNSKPEREANASEMSPSRFWALAVAAVRTNWRAFRRKLRDRIRLPYSRTGAMSEGVFCQSPRWMKFSLVSSVLVSRSTCLRRNCPAFVSSSLHRAKSQTLPAVSLPRSLLSRRRRSCEEELPWVQSAFENQPSVFLDQCRGYGRSGLPFSSAMLG